MNIAKPIKLCCNKIIVNGEVVNLSPLDQNRTPLFNALMNYVNEHTIPFHVPGHKQGRGMNYLLPLQGTQDPQVKNIKVLKHKLVLLHDQTEFIPNAV